MNGYEKIRFMISIHVPAWGTTQFDRRGSYANRISVDRLLDATTQFDRRGSYTAGNFNPRSRVGNDGIKNVIIDALNISIHVPAWGTTKCVQWSVIYVRYFNPRSRVGNDGTPSGYSYIKYIFQSTFPRGERPHSILIPPSDIKISIHVPAWGTTLLHLQQVSLSLISIHVPAWGTTL